MPQSPTLWLRRCHADYLLLIEEERNQSGDVFRSEKSPLGSRVGLRRHHVLSQAVALLLQVAPGGWGAPVDALLRDCQALCES